MRRPPKIRIKALLHTGIILNFLAGSCFAALKVFTTPKTTEFFERRLYAYEFWIIIGFFSLYLAATFLNRN